MYRYKGSACCRSGIEWIDNVFFMYILMVISNENILIYTYCLLMLTGNRIHRYRTNSKHCTILFYLCEHTDLCYDLISVSEFLILISIYVSLYHNVFIKDTIFNLCILYKLYLHFDVQCWSMCTDSDFYM